jgi:bifunctional UDP-N-acetylglucosamine pyrophosphorylase/glucosamine-1-phosphate N-acetyltransferase
MSSEHTPLAQPMTAPATSLREFSVVILAAGRGTRMRSTLPKVLHPVAGVPMVRLTCDLVREAGAGQIVVVVAPSAQAQIAAAVGDGVDLAVQSEPRGTGHAALAAREAAKQAHVLVVNADLPLLSRRTLLELAGRHLDSASALTFLTAYLDDPTGYGRVMRRSGRVHGVVEDADADAATRGQPEVNVGVYAAEADWLWPTLDELPASASGEIYLTDIIARSVENSGGVESYQVVEAAEVQQANDRVQLAAVERAMRERIRHRLMEEGVTLVDPATTYIDAHVGVAADTTILPGTHLLGETSIATECRIGPNAIIRDTTIAEGCEIGASTIEGATIGRGSDIGPYCHLRPGAELGADVHLGNYVELKATTIGDDTQVGHFSYLGDAEIGSGVNIGAGTITANYDGTTKHRTVIEDGAFIGSDSILVAPVVVRARGRTAAGAVVTTDVPEDQIAIGMPAEMRAIEGRSSASSSER